MAEFAHEMLLSDRVAIVRRLMEALHLQIVFDRRWPTRQVEMHSGLQVGEVRAINDRFMGIHFVGPWTRLPLALGSLMTSEGPETFLLDPRQNETIYLSPVGGYQRNGIRYVGPCMLAREAHCHYDNEWPPKKVSQELRRAYDAAVRLLRREFLRKIATTPACWVTPAVEQLLVAGRARVLVAGRWVGREDLPSEYLASGPHPQPGGVDRGTRVENGTGVDSGTGPIV